MAWQRPSLLVVAVAAVAAIAAIVLRATGVIDGALMSMGCVPLAIALRVRYRPWKLS
jgi:TRAP-type mannitol/chloroaromatic compound transport system permease large subunit